MSGWAFLREFARTGSVSAACRASGFTRRTVYNWRDTDADFRAAYEARLWATAAARKRPDTDEAK